MDDYETCLKKFKDPEMCRFGLRVVHLAETLRLDECLERHEAQRCLNMCLKNCKGENCNQVCLYALDAAVAKNIARKLARGAVAAATETDLTIPEAAAMGFHMLLKEPASDCVTKVASMRILGMVAVELRYLLGVQDLLLLLAPAIAMAYECIRDEAFNLLDMVAPSIGQEMAERIAAALQEGVVKIGRITLKFPPAKPT
jgi:hypothetical protein